jgi:hypothetical protein
MTESAGLSIEKNRYFSNQGNVVKSIVPLAAHTVEQSKGWSQHWDELPVREFSNRAMMAKSDPKPAFLAQHQSKRNFEHRPLGDLVGSLSINCQILPINRCLTADIRARTFSGNLISIRQRASRLCKC